MVTANSKIDLSKYLEMSEEELEDLTSSSIAPRSGSAIYKFRVSDDEVKEWDDGRCTLSLRTEVVEGEHAGKSGPFMNLSLHPFIQAGEIVSDEKMEELRDVAKAKFIRRIQLLTNGAPFAIAPGDEKDVLESVGVIAGGLEFIAAVKRGNNGYAQFSNYYSLSNPPRGYEQEVEAFKLG